jgi:Flp pilus assembly protein TadG
MARDSTSIPPRVRSEKGAALVEFALVLPVLILVLFGMLQFGLVFNYWIDETHLANEGARWAAVNNWPSSGTLQQYIRQQAGSNDLRNGAHVCISFPSGTKNVGDPVQVDMTYTAGLPIISAVSTRLFGGAIPSTVRVAGRSVMRLEAVPNYTAGDGGTGAC